MFDCEGWGEVGVVEGEADFLVGFAAGDLVFSQWSVVVQGGETMGESGYRVSRGWCPPSHLAMLHDLVHRSQPHIPCSIISQQPTRKTPQRRRPHRNHHPQIPLPVRIQQQQHRRPSTDRQPIPQRKRRRLERPQPRNRRLPSQTSVTIYLISLIDPKVQLTAETAFNGAMVSLFQ